MRIQGPGKAGVMKVERIPRWLANKAKKEVHTSQDRDDRLMECLYSPCLQRIAHKKGDDQENDQYEQRPRCVLLFLTGFSICKCIV